MKILVVGGGPAGLSAAALLARTARSNHVTLIERRTRHDTHGWGVTLRNQTLEFLQLDRLLQPQRLEGRRFFVGGHCRVDYPNPPDAYLITVARDELIAALSQRCEEGGVTLCYGVDAQQVAQTQLDEYDLVVAADGAHSAIRGRWAAAFESSLSEGKNHYAWLATPYPFRKLTIVLSDAPEPLLAWAYQFAPGLSSFIVEREEPRSKGVDATRPLAPVDPVALARSFAPELNGGALIAAPSTRWARFPVVRCERLHTRNLVLIGDAAHTTHFSQGFGTLFAFDDACALSAALQGASTVAAGLQAYQRVQSPRIAQFQAAAETSRLWSERLLAAARSADESQVRALVAARWPVNVAPLAPAPLSDLLTVGAAHA